MQLNSNVDFEVRAQINKYSCDLHSGHSYNCQSMIYCTLKYTFEIIVIIFLILNTLNKHEIFTHK